MSQRMTMDEVLKEYGVPQIKLDIHATRSELLKLREKLMAIRDLSNGTEQGYLDLDCKLYIDVDDIDRYLSGELDTVGEIYAFPEDIKSKDLDTVTNMILNNEYKLHEDEENSRVPDGGSNGNDYSSCGKYELYGYGLRRQRRGKTWRRCQECAKGCST